MDTAITTAVASAVASITDLMTDNLPVILAFAGLLIGLGLAWRYVKKFVGKKA